MYLKDHNLIFLHIPKCAGTSVEKAFGFFDQYQGWERQDHRTYREFHPASLNPNRFRNRSNFAELTKRLIKKRPNPKANIYPTRNEFKGCEVFAIVRNPYTRAFSWYKNVISDQTYWDRFGVSDKTPFNEFLQRFLGRDSLRTQMHWLMDFDGNLPSNIHLLRFENLAEDASAFFAARNLEVTLGHELKSQASLMGETIFDDRSKLLIREFYAEDFNALNYSLEFGDRFSSR